MVYFGIKNSNYRHGKYCKDYKRYCIKCNNQICVNGKSGLCNRCVRIGILNGFYKKTHSKKSKKMIGIKSKKKFTVEYMDKIHKKFEGFRKKLCSGYIYVTKYNHPFRNKQGDVAEHRLIIEKKIGRYLQPKEEVHHKDLNKSNNKLSNLYLCANRSEHKKAHNSINKLIPILLKNNIITFKNGEYIMRKDFLRSDWMVQK